MSTKTSRPKYDSDYVKLALSFAAYSRVKISNRNFAKHIGVTEGAIRKWRKEYPDFDRAFLDPAGVIASKINIGVMDNLDKRSKMTIVKGEDGVKAIKDDVLPTHNDLLVASKLGFRKSMVGFDEQHRKSVIADLNKQLVSGDVTYLDAVAELELEEILVPASWKAREVARILKLKNQGEITAPEAVLQIESSGITVPKLLQQEAENHLGLNRTEITGLRGGPIASTNLDLSQFSLEDLMKLRKAAKNNKT
ncbi:hypothetical protein [Providencia stuartii]|uniref:hypothetical protein n=1 Tax=Providencia stuartii TaxID=588 RepID=UPI00112381B6|nr:hypothetical protein [Providencia stuartii]